MSKRRIFFVLAISCFSLTITRGQEFHSMRFQPTSANSLSLSSTSGKTVLIIVSDINISIELEGVSELKSLYPNLEIFVLPVTRLDGKVPIINAVSKSVKIIASTSDSTDTNGKLLKWLTRSDKNRHFTVDQLEAGQKYFIDGNGELYGVLPPAFKLTDPRIHAVLTRTTFEQAGNK